MDLTHHNAPKGKWLLTYPSAYDFELDKTMNCVNRFFSQDAAERYAAYLGLNYYTVELDI